MAWEGRKGRQGEGRRWAGEGGGACGGLARGSQGQLRCRAGLAARGGGPGLRPAPQAPWLALRRGCPRALHQQSDRRPPPPRLPDSRPPQALHPTPPHTTGSLLVPPFQAVHLGVAPRHREEHIRVPLAALGLQEKTAGCVGGWGHRRQKAQTLSRAAPRSLDDGLHGSQPAGRVHSARVVSVPHVQPSPNTHMGKANRSQTMPCVLLRGAPLWSQTRPPPAPAQPHRRPEGGRAGGRREGGGRATAGQAGCSGSSSHTRPRARTAQCRLRYQHGAGPGAPSPGTHTLSPRTACCLRCLPPRPGRWRGHRWCGYSPAPGPPRSGTASGRPPGRPRSRRRGALQAVAA
jgi:hypothetical protein